MRGIEEDDRRCRSVTSFGLLSSRLLPCILIITYTCFGGFHGVGCLLNLFGFYFSSFFPPFFFFSFSLLLLIHLFCSHLFVFSFPRDLKKIT